jgi:hypothetical protein
MKIHFLFGVVALILSLNSVFASTGDPLLDLFAGTDLTETVTESPEEVSAPIGDIPPAPPSTSATITPPNDNIPEEVAPPFTPPETVENPIVTIDEPFHGVAPKTTTVLIETEVIPSYSYAAAISKLPSSAQSKTYLTETGPTAVILISGIIAIFSSFLIFKKNTLHFT